MISLVPPSLHWMTNKKPMTTGIYWYSCSRHPTDTRVFQIKVTRLQDGLNNGLLHGECINYEGHFSNGLIHNFPGRALWYRISDLIKKS